MLEIPCPWCGPRDQCEFSYGGEAHIVRPLQPESLNDAEWADYLYMRKNLKGKNREQWCHSAGCRRWFNVVRDTISNQIQAVYRIGEQLPGDEQ
jgi:heterotetrameric sarcosine oxidase delta subunit